MSDKCIVISSLVGMTISFLFVLFSIFAVMISFGVKMKVAGLIVGASGFGFIVFVGMCAYVTKRCYDLPQGYTSVQ